MFILMHPLSSYYIYQLFFHFSAANFIVSNNSKSILLVGDSVDRFITVDWCEAIYQTGHHNVKKGKGSEDIWAVTCPWIKPWVKSPITEESDPYFICFDTEGNSIANLHMLGSAPKGPYYKDNENLVGNLYRNSLDRINKSIEIYVSSFFWPTKLIYNTILWDTLYIIERSKADGIDLENLLTSSTYYSNIHNILIQFKRNYDGRLDQIENLLTIAKKRDNRVNTEIVLRTAAWVPTGGNLLHLINYIVRQIAMERGYSLYDFDKDVWSTVEYAYDTNSKSGLFRDWIHPQHYFTMSAGEKLLHKQYSLHYHHHLYRMNSGFLHESINHTIIPDMWRRYTDLNDSHLHLKKASSSQSARDDSTQAVLHRKVALFKQHLVDMNLGNLSVYIIRTAQPLHKLLNPTTLAPNSTISNRLLNHVSGSGHSHHQQSNKSNETLSFAAPTYFYMVGQPTGCRSITSNCNNRSSFSEDRFPLQQRKFFHVENLCTLHAIFRLLHLNFGDVLYVPLHLQGYLKQRGSTVVARFPDIFPYCKDDEKDTSDLSSSTSPTQSSVKCFVSMPSKRAFMVIKSKENSIQFRQAERCADRNLMREDHILTNQSLDDAWLERLESSSLVYS